MMEASCFCESRRLQFHLPWRGRAVKAVEGKVFLDMLLARRRGDANITGKDGHRVIGRHILDYFLILIGLAGLFTGGEALVRGSVGIARRFSISPLVIGLTVVGFGTSTPELLVSLQAALLGAPAIALGNVLGSNIANILLIGGLTALVWPIQVSKAAFGRDVAVMLAVAVLLIPVFATGQIGRVAGLILLAVLAAYLAVAVLSTRSEPDAGQDEGAPATFAKSLMWVAFGLGALMLGARFLVDGSVSVARGLGVSEAFIGLTVVAVGTSLPELATSLMAAFRKTPEIAIGNILGSNIFNVLGILGATAVFAPIPVAERFLSFDLPAMIVVSLVMAGLLLGLARLGRRAGGAMVLSYASYVYLAQ
jgi:cation:H+ antiporter